MHTFVLPEASQIVFDRKVVHPNTKFTVIGYEFEYFKSESHFLGSHKLHNYSKYFNTYTFEVKDIPDGNYPYRYQSEVNEIQTPRTIEVRELNVDKADKTDYYIGERIILNGNFIKDEKYFVGFNDSHLYQSFVCTMKGELFAENLSLGKVNKTLRIGYEANTTVYFPLNFDILNLGYTIENFSPKKGYRGQLITIKVKGFIMQ
ncbi:hypothetical protein [Sphingobacterium cavernae]|uniref:hypothetical protein n=1 Tax=Sphingobacterium cavernae TaxID=2592657 RepID=UPI0012302089|nr:hypothetical protein [Sphingobacterium cavernae]